MNDGNSSLDQTLHNEMLGFKECGFYWVKNPRENPNSLAQNTVYEYRRVCYSIPFSDIEKFVLKEFWDASRGASGSFGPDLPFTSERHCRRGLLEPGHSHFVDQSYFDLQRFVDPFWDGNDDRPEKPFGRNQPITNNDLSSNIGDVRPLVINWDSRPHNTMPPEMWQSQDLIRAGSVGMFTSIPNCSC